MRSGYAGQFKDDFKRDIAWHAQFATRQIPKKSGNFVIAGDLQRTSLAERGIRRKDNRTNLAQLVAEIAGRDWDFMVLPGDSVSSPLQRNWRDFDDVTAPLRELARPLFPVMGNHDYGLMRQSARERYFARFPHLENQCWYWRIYGSLGMIFLDSNVRKFTDDEWHEQMMWYHHELKRFDALPEVRSVIVFVHHPPYTNAVWIRPNKMVQSVFVPPFLDAPKAIMMVSGHVHAYECFERYGKTFLVAGSGGPRMRLRTGWWRRCDGDYFDGPAVRSFHYVWCTQTPLGLRFSVHGLFDGRFEIMDQFIMPWASRGGGEATRRVSRMR